MSEETIEGFDIPLRELTEEEKNREITIDRIRDFHYEVGEDLLDQVGHLISQPLVFAGFVLHKHKEHAEKIVAHVNSNLRHLDVHCFGELDFYEFNEEDDIDGIYYDVVEFVNLTPTFKARINQILIQVQEHYNS